tara:strand:+ start:179 stop:526 length:348 start_codon:yes stop_codon:yes gene_type:complete
MVKDIGFSEFKKRIIKERQTCVVKFYSETCPLCLNLAPLYKNISKKYAGLVDFYKVDTIKEEKLSDIFKMDGVPTIYFFYDGKYGEIPYPYNNPDDLTGYREADIIDYIEKRLKK